MSTSRPAPPARATLDGVVSGHALHAKCELSDVYEKPLLLIRGFHWVNELPVNR